MRINYYKFPESTPENVLLEHGCDKNDHCIGGLTVSSVKALIKKHGGCGWTEHCERDGGCFEVTEIKLSGNNSRFTYNHHL